MTRDDPRAPRLHVAEDDLLRAVTDALTWAGYLWTHPRRSDRALMMGSPGVPDILATSTRGTARTFALELKSESGKVTDSQRWWLDALHLRTIESLVIRPGDLDAFIRDVT